MKKYIRQLEGRDRWALATFIYVGLRGAVLQLRGALLPNIQDTFLVSESLLGLIAPAGVLGFTAAALTTGMIAGKIDIKKFMLIGVAATALTTGLIAFTPIYSLFLAAIVLSGLAAGIPGGLGRPFLGHLFSEKRGQIFNLHETVWAFGASFGPLMATLVLTFSVWRTAYILMGLALIPVFYMMLMTDVSDAEVNERQISFNKLWAMLKSPTMIGVIVILFFNVGVEGGFFTWLPYFLSQDFPQSIANITLSAFLAAYVPGRLINSRLTKRFRYTTLILFSSVAVTIFLAVAFIFTSGYVTIASVILIGFCISTVFPNLFSLATESFPEHSGPVNALAMTFDPLGFSIIPALMGFIADQFTINLAMQFLLVPMVMVTFTSFMLCRKT